tara:strand:- start:304 stop:474 length:171 start_codon:yes stop_codon:yes gene_type:complete
MATRKMKEMGTGMVGTTPVTERRLVPQGTPNSANDPTPEPTMDINKLAEMLKNAQN